MMCVLRMSVAIVLLLAGCSTSLARQQDMQSFKTNSASELLGVVLSSRNNQHHAISDPCSLHACIATAPLSTAASSTCKLQQIGNILPMRGSLILEPLLLLDSLQDRNSNDSDSSILGSNSTMKHAHTNSSKNVEVAPSKGSSGGAGVGDPVTVHMAASCPCSKRQDARAGGADNLVSPQQRLASAAGATQHGKQNIALQVEQPGQHVQQGDVVQLMWTDTVCVTLTLSGQEQLLERDSQTWNIATPVPSPEDVSAAVDDDAVSADGSSGSSSTFDGSRQLLVVPLQLRPPPVQEQLTAAEPLENSNTTAAAEEQQAQANVLHMTRAAGWKLWLGRVVLSLLLLGGHVLVYLHAAV